MELDPEAGAEPVRDVEVDRVHQRPRTDRSRSERSSGMEPGQSRRSSVAGSSRHGIRTIRRAMSPSGVGRTAA